MSLSIMRQAGLSCLMVPYLFGGDDPSGWDCSGLVQEILASAGEDPAGDQTAQALFDYFLPRSRFNERVEGALAFFGKSNRLVNHVGYMLDGAHMLEAGGGGKTTVSRDAAIKQNAFVRIRPITRRPDLVAVLRPHYAFETRRLT